MTGESDVEPWEPREKRADPSRPDRTISQDLHPHARPVRWPAFAPFGKGTSMTTSNLCILLVEDDASVRGQMAVILAEAGFQVFEAATGRHALRSGVGLGEIDILVTGVNRPWPDGITVARHARAHHPGIAILFLAGDAEQHRLADFPGAYRSLPKPFTRQGIEAALDAIRHELVDERVARPGPFLEQPYIPTKPTPSHEVPLTWPPEQR
jgi:CheY-like chemotaxis protein